MFFFLKTIKEIKCSGTEKKVRSKIRFPFVLLLSGYSESDGKKLVTSDYDRASFASKMNGTANCVIQLQMEHLNPGFGISTFFFLDSKNNRIKFLFGND